MTIEQAKSELMQIYGALSPNKQRAIDTLVKIEPCEDAISRQDVWFKLTNGAYDGETTEQFIDRIAKEIESMPSINPQEPKYCDRNICIKNEYNGIGCDECEVTKSQEPKIGHWIEDDMTYCGVDLTNYKCDKCGEIGGSWRKGLKPDKLPKYCMNCGAKMESEV